MLTLHASHDEPRCSAAPVFGIQGPGPAGRRAARFPTAGRPSGGERRRSQQNMPRRVEISKQSITLRSNTPLRRTSLAAKLEFCRPKFPPRPPPARLDLIERPCRVLGTHALPARRHCLALCPHHRRVPQRPRGMRRRHASQRQRATGRADATEPQGSLATTPLLHAFQGHR
ncbi:hypothetical protein L1887_63200 [Cichorium endivia]|nr:hypothetical protein L1887_63200 [Cichorium endivia]